MEYRFTSKFNIGDTVYTYEMFDDYCCCIKEAYDVERICYKIDIDHTALMYSVIPQKHDGLRWNCYVVEDMLFATYKECKAWCDQYNKETKHGNS